MPENEVKMMRDAFVFLRDHNDPPAVGTGNAEMYWYQTGIDMAALMDRWSNHPLITAVLFTLYDYLEQKCLAKGGAAE